MPSISWNKFDANKKDPKAVAEIALIKTKILGNKGIDINNRSAVKEFATKEITDYESGLKEELNETMGVQVFRPEQFDSDSSNDESLNELRNWLSKQTFDWKNGSRTVQLGLRKFPSAGSIRIKGGREYVDLDNLVGSLISSTPSI